MLKFTIENVLAVKVTCNRSEGFREIWDKALKKVKFVNSSEGMGFQPIERTEVVQLDLFLPDKPEIGPLDIQNVLEAVAFPLLFIFDEFDSIKDESTKTMLADTMKALSDNAPHITLLVVGIGDNVTSLIGEHRSLERCIKQIQMPRMSDDELQAIIDKGLSALQIEMNSEVKSMIVQFSIGFPHYTHLLSKYSATAALNDDSRIVEKTHFLHAINESLTNADQSIRGAFQKATIVSKDSSRFEDVISAAATAEEDEHRTFSMNDLIDAFRILTGQTVKRQSLAYSVGKLCTEERASILEVVGRSKNIRYRFKNPLIKVYVKLKLLQGKASQPRPLPLILPGLQ